MAVVVQRLLAADAAGVLFTRDPVSGDIFSEASEIEMKSILDLLRGDSPVTVKVGGTSTEMSDHDRIDAVGKFTKDCELS